MKSFPSAFTRSSNSVAGSAFGSVKSIKDVVNGLKNIGMSALRQSITGDTTSLSDIGEPLDFTKERNLTGLTTVKALNISNNLSTVFSEVNPKHNLEWTSVSNFGNINNTTGTQNATGANNISEDPFKFGHVAIESLNNYNFIFSNAVSQVLQSTTLKGNTDKNGETNSVDIGDFISFGAAPSLFNTKSAIYVNGIVSNVPLRNNTIVPQDELFSKDKLPTGFENINNSGVENELNEYYKITESKSDKSSTSNAEGSSTSAGANNNENNQNNQNTEDKKNNTEEASATIESPTANAMEDDCSIKTLVELSKVPENEEGGHSMTAAPLGWATFRYADFMFCRDVGKIANNHLIVLRKFPVPIGDNITKVSGLYSKVKIKKVIKDANTQANTGTGGSTTKVTNTEDVESTGACVGKLVAWFGNEENKLEDICKYEYKATYREYKAQIEPKDSQEDQSSPMASMVNLMSGDYRSKFAQGQTGGNNAILGWVAGKVNRYMPFNIASNVGQNTNAEFLRNYDNNHVYEPKNTIQDNNIYEGKLQFTQSFTLTFNYKLRAYDNINPRAAMSDLVANILEVTFMHGVYWGGKHKLIGPQQNKSGWKKANAIVNHAWDDAGSLLKNIFNGNFDKVRDTAMNIFTNAKQAISDTAGKVVDALKSGNLGDFLSGTSFIKGISQIGKGMLLNGLGRPQIYAWQSIIDGSPQGFWHVTIGNPRKPILTMGNLILENTTVQHYGPLGIDDFPTEIKVTCQLKHAKSRDATEISKMYTGGQMAIYAPLDINSSAHIRDYNENYGKYAPITQSY